MNIFFQGGNKNQAFFLKIHTTTVWDSIYNNYTKEKRVKHGDKRKEVCIK